VLSLKKHAQFFTREMMALCDLAGSASRSNFDVLARWADRQDVNIHIDFGGRLFATGMSLTVYADAGSEG